MGTDNSTWQLGRGSICSLRGLWRAAQPLYQHVEMPFLWAQLCASQILIQLHLYHLSTPDSRHFLHGAQTRTRHGAMKSPSWCRSSYAYLQCQQITILIMLIFYCTRYKRIHLPWVSFHHRIHLQLYATASQYDGSTAARVSVKNQINLWKYCKCFLYCNVWICTVCKVVVNLHSILWIWISLWI